MTDPTQPTGANTPTDPRKLLKALLTHFNENELKGLVFELGDVDYEDLPPGGRKDKARELVRYYVRQNRLQKLVAMFQQKRPSVPLATIALDESDEDPTLTVTTTSSSGTILPTSETRSNTMIVGKTFSALVRALSQKEVKTAVISFQTDFEASAKQIVLLSDYKLVHDMFQELENQYFMVHNSLRRLPADDTAWDDITLYEPELQGKIDDLLNVTARETFAADENRWVEHLKKAKEQVRAGIDAYDHEPFKSGMRLVFRILNRQPSRINAQLVATASAMRLATLESAMTTIATTLANSEIDLDLVNEVQTGVDAMYGLENRLQELVRDHNAWQELDDEMRRIGPSVTQGIDELLDAWFDLEPMTNGLVNGRSDEWAIRLAEIVVELGKSLEEGMAIKVRRSFNQYRTQVGRQFRQVDKELLLLCDDLKRIGEPIDLMLRQFN